MNKIRDTGTPIRGIISLHEGILCQHFKSKSKLGQGGVPDLVPGETGKGRGKLVALSMVGGFSFWCKRNSYLVAVRVLATREARYFATKASTALH